MIKQLTFSPEIRPLWNSIASSGFPFSQFDWHEAWSSTISDDWVPYPIHVNGHLIAPLARRENAVTFSGGREVSDYMDLIGPEHEKPNAWRAIINYCSQQGIRMLVFPNVPEGSATLTYFRNEVKRLKTIHHVSIEKEDVTPILALPSAWETYTGNLDRKDKHELERKLRKFEREHPSWTLRTSQSPSEDITILLGQMKTDSAKNSFLTPSMQQFFQEIVRRFEDSIELLILEEKGQAIASTLSFVTPLRRSSI